jgi:hypothetical protein
MFRREWLLSVMLLASLCGMAQTSSRKTSFDSCLDEKLERYFSQREIRARHIVNNDLDPEPTKASADKIEISSVVVEWIVTPREKFKVDIAIKINGQRIELKDQPPINLADEERTIGPELIDTWDQIRLYDLGGDRKIVAITLRPGMCTGLMCGVSAQLYFDIKSKRSSFFGSYRTDGEAKLYSFGGDGESFVVATNFTGDPHGTVAPATVTYELYRLLPDGRFVRAGNASGALYFVKHVQQPEKSKIGDAVEDRWIERIRLDQ